MIRTFQGKLIKINRENFKNDYDYFRFLWKKKFNVELNKKDNNKDMIKKLVK